jgi:beta-galactosidase/beta-glucuronidase
LLHWGETNAIAVRVDNAFNEHMLPRGRSSDWAHDGGIFRPVQILLTPKVFVERVDVEATFETWARRTGSAGLPTASWMKHPI